MPPTPSPAPSPVEPTPLPQLPAPDFHQYAHGISLLGGWLPLTIEIVAAVAVLAVVARRTSRWWLLWFPVSVTVGVLAALTAHTYVDSEGLASDPAPFGLWIWVGLFAAGVAVAVFGWRGSPWWRRGLSVVTIPLTLLAALVALNQWVGYYPSLQTAWGALTAGPLPNQVDAADLPALRNTVQTSGKLVEVDIGSDASGFKHRSEYVYLPPAWFAGETPPRLPVIMMVAGEFNTPADWIRTGNAMPIIDGYAKSHGGQAPIFAFVDSGGSFNNDTECVNGPRGNAADHLTKDVRPYVVKNFGASDQAANWAVVGWSMGGTCAIDLTVMHPELFSTFEDIAGDHGPTAGTKEQTISRLYGGDAAAWDQFDPRSAMLRHGPYQGVSGWFEDTVKPANGTSPYGSGHRPQSDAPMGFGGHDEFRDSDEAGAADDLCATAKTVGISCSVHRIISYHTWQFAERGFSDALPWLAAQIGTPGSTGS
ncbi:alpha/beta hydrolase family protein [Mycolicibacterium sp. CH28]|uniref:alpha/beta hydrolase n=1 Tax=Mycolicibacterium sp. CH28 TaxID=2512237 RepID=UPI0019117271|nr:alpha/beta hydrolase-fold protein [Mycolicibacterium sp. CH28]